MIKLEKEGYTYTSKAGFKYELLEGVSIGSTPQYTSDIIFIMFSDLDIKVDTPLVNFLYGATFINECIEEYNNMIGEMVGEYERRNNLWK